MNDLDLSLLHIENGSYKERFLSLSKKPFLKDILSGELYSLEEVSYKLKGFENQCQLRMKNSVIVLVNFQEIKKVLSDNKAPFSSFIQEIKTEFSGCFFFNPLGTLHFTLAAQNVTEESVPKIEKLLQEKRGFHVVIKGFMITNFINGRVFLNVNANYEAIKLALIDFGSVHYRESRIGFLNLKRNLTKEEKSKLGKILKKYQNKIMFKFDVNKVSIVEQDNSLMVLPRIISEITLS